MGKNLLIKDLNLENFNWCILKVCIALGLSWDFRNQTIAAKKVLFVTLHPVSLRIKMFAT